MHQSTCYWTVVFGSGLNTTDFSVTSMNCSTFTPLRDQLLKMLTVCLDVIEASRRNPSKQLLHGPFLSYQWLQNYILKPYFSCVLLTGAVMPQDGRKDNVLGIEQHKGENFFVLFCSSSNILRKYLLHGAKQG